MSIFANPFKLCWSPYLPPCFTSKTIPHTNRWILQYKRCTYTATSGPSDRSILFSVRYELNVMRIFLSSVGRHRAEPPLLYQLPDTRPALTMTKPCIVRGCDWLSSSNSYQNEQPLISLPSNWKKIVDIKLSPCVKYDVHWHHLYELHIWSIDYVWFMGVQTVALAHIHDKTEGSLITRYSETLYLSIGMVWWLCGRINTWI